MGFQVQGARLDFGVLEGLKVLGVESRDWVYAVFSFECWAGMPGRESRSGVRNSFRCWWRLHAPEILSMLAR